MQLVLLLFHLFLAVGITFLVLMQRSEGGALGMGGGGGSLMSGRGATDALVRITTFAGAAFFATSLGLSLLTGWSERQNQRSIDLGSSSFSAPLLPREAPAAEPLTPVTAAPIEAPPTETAAIAEPTPVAPAPAQAATRASPLGAAPTISAPPRTQTAATTPPRAPAAAAPRQATPAPARTMPASGPAAAPTTSGARPPSVVRPPPTTAQPASIPVSRQRSAPPPATAPAESIQIEAPPPPVQRSRAGPDQ